MPSKTTALQTNQRVAVAQFRPEILAIHDLITPDLADLHIVAAARVFAADTSIILRKWESPVQPGVLRYPVVLDDEEVILLTNHPECCKEPSGWLSPQRVSIHETLFYDPIENQIALRQCNDLCHSTSLCAGIIVQPSVNACSLPRLFMSRYYETLMHLAISRILHMDNVPWQDKSNAGARYNLYNADLGTILADKAMRYTTAPIRIKNRRMI